MSPQTLLKKPFTLTFLIGALFAIACADDPSNEGPADGGACEGTCDESPTPSAGEPKGAPGPKTCAAPEGAACTHASLGGEGCGTIDDCAWECAGAKQLCRDLTINDNTTVEGDARCVLEALRDGTEGTFRWGASEGAGFSSYYQNITIVSGRRALRDAKKFFDILADAGREGPSPLRDAAYFENCLAQQGPAALKACLANAVEGCGLVQPN